MHDIEQQILDTVEKWAGNKVAALDWYENEYIPALGSTAKVAVENGHQKAVFEYLDALSLGAFA
jgi:hypothetical protein